MKGGGIHRRDEELRYRLSLGINVESFGKLNSVKILNLLMVRR